MRQWRPPAPRAIRAFPATTPRSACRPRSTLWVSFPSRPTPRLIAATLLEAITGRASPVLAGPWGGALTVPPELRRFLATWHHEREPPAGAGAVPLFPGNSHGRASQPAIRRRLARLDAPASRWEDPLDTTIGDGAHADGRALLLRLSAWHLWLDQPDETAGDAPG